MSDVNRHPAEEIDALLRDNVADLVAYLLGTPGKRRGNEMRWGNKGSLVVTIAGRDKGRITRFDGDGKGRPPLRFIMEEYAYSFPQAVEWAANWLGVSPDYKPDPEAERRREKKRKRERAEAVVEEKRQRQKRISWAEQLAEKSVPVAGTDGEAYLRVRAITNPQPECVRYSAAPSALTLIARSPDDSIQAVHRVFLDGDRKANIRPQKRTNGPTKNAAVRLPGTGCRLYLAEGPETALSVWQATGAPTWAVLGQNFRDHDIPGDITEIVIAADNDLEGSPAFKQTSKSAEHYRQRGYVVFIARPDGPPKYDFNDVHRVQGVSVVRAMLEAAPPWVGAPTLYQTPTGTVDDAREGVTKFIGDWLRKVQEYWKRKAEYDAAR